MRTLIKIFIILVIGLLLAIWSPWNNWNLNFASILGYKAPDQYGGLVISSLAGEIKIFIDDSEVGTVSPETSPYENFQVQPGLRKIKLTRVSDPAGFYYELNKVINFEGNVEVVMAYDLGPSLEFTEGHTLSARSKKAKTPVELSLKTTPSQATVMADDITVGVDKLIVDLDLSKQHTIKVSHPGYETLQFVILPDSQDDRNKLVDFDLLLEVNLTLIPLELTTK
jgi:hypothetical protein